MNGIFQYQVPGQRAQVNQQQQSARPTEHLNQNKIQNFEQPFKADTFQQLSNVLEQLLQQIKNSPSDKKPPSENTKPSPGEVTTQAVGEEDGGTQSPPLEIQPPPGEVTTLAVGEEDGGTQPPVDVKPPLTDVTTLAVGEEDGGHNS